MFWRRYLIGFVAGAFLCLGLSVAGRCQTYPAVDYQKLIHQEQSYVWTGDGGGVIDAYVDLKCVAKRPAGSSPLLSINYTLMVYANCTTENPPNPPVMGAQLYQGSCQVTGSLPIGFQQNLDFRNGYGATLNKVSTPGRYAGAIQLTMYSAVKSLSYSFDLTEAELATGGDNGAIPPVPGSDPGNPIYTAPDATEHTWIENFWHSQVTMSADVRENWDEMVDNLKNVGPWGQINALKTALNSEALLRNALAPTITIPTFQADGSRGANLTMPFLSMNTQVSEGGMWNSGEGTWTLTNPWFTTDATVNHVGYWVSGMRRALRFFFWAMFAVSVIIWVRGRIVA